MKSAYVRMIAGLVVIIVHDQMMVANSLVLGLKKHNEFHQCLLNILFTKLEK